MIEEESEYEKSLRKIDAGAEEIRARAAAVLRTENHRASVFDGKGPFGGDPEAKARAIQAALGPNVEWRLSTPGAIAFRNSILGTGVVFKMEAFMARDFTELDVAEQLEMIRHGQNIPKGGYAPGGVVSGNAANTLPRVTDLSRVQDDTETLAKAMKMAAAPAAALSTKLRALTEANGTAIEALRVLSAEASKAMNDEAAVRQAAEDGLEAIIFDVLANTLIGSDAVREAASEWLTKITARLTSLVANEEEQT